LRTEQEQLRRRFITFVSHQLQSPLSAVHQYLDVLRRIDDSAEAAEKRAEWLDRCLERTAGLQSLIRDWLALSRIEGGSFVRATEAVDLRDVVVPVVAAASADAAAKDVALIANLPDEPCSVFGERTALDMLVDNLVVNAIKYNRPGGRVTITVAVRGNEIILSVADTGIGISEAHLEFLFNEFFRANTDRTIAGTGLGLAICKRIVNELGGKIEVESSENVGTTFRVLLPLVHHAEAALEPMTTGASL
jgi:signal transduction histidine kinase